MLRSLIRCTASCLMLAFLFSANPPDYAAIVLCAVLIHEAGHLVAALFMGIAPRGFCVTPFGFRITFQLYNVSYMRECGIALSGPAANLLSAAVSLPLCAGNRRVLFFAVVSVLAAVFNLMPVSGCDGGVILAALLNSRLDAFVSYRICRIVSLIFSAVLWCAAVYLQLRVGGNMTLLLMSIYMLILMLSS